MIDTVALKNNILELAFKGDLVSSIEGDVAISDLISSLPSPSNKRIGLLKKGSDTVFPYDLPDNWDIVPLGKITSYGDTPTKIMASDVESDTWILELEDIEAGGRLLKKTRVGSRQAIGEKTTFKCGQVLYSKLRPYLKKVLQADENGICTPELIAFDVYAGINPRYVMYYLICNFVDKVINQRSYGVKMPRVDAQFMVNLPVPIPTIAVQNKIVDIIDEAFSAIEMINNLQQQYSSNLEVLKSKIIDAGIQGKLTEQLPEDGTADELLEQIAEEKKLLVKEKKIKATKALSEIAEDEIPFEIPDNWKWVRLGDICRKIVDGDHNPPTGTKEKTKYLMLSAQNINNDRIVNIDNARYLSKEIFDEEHKRTKLEKGDVLLTIVATLGRSCVFNEDYNICFQRSVCVISTMIDPNYLKRYFDCSYIQKYMVNNATGAAQPGFYLNKVEKLCIPVPPCKEQIRIVEKLDNILQMI